MSAVLSDTAVQEALSQLDGWSSDGSALHRHVALDDDQHAEVSRSVMATAESMNHHPDIGREGANTTFTLSTHSEGGITALDATLAAKIDEAVAVVIANGKPGPHA